MPKTPSIDASTISTDALTPTPPEPIEQGDYVQFIQYFPSEAKPGDFDKMTAAGYVTQMLANGDVVIEFNDRRFRVQPHACKIICKQYRIEGL